MSQLALFDASGGPGSAEGRTRQGPLRPPGTTRRRPPVRLMAITADDIVNTERLWHVIERSGDWPRVVNVISPLLCDLEAAGTR